MKRLCTFLSLSLFAACSIEREVQADTISASLVKINVINRYPNLRQKMLTWRGTDNVLYVTFEPVATEVTLGDTRQVMVRK